MVFFYKWWNIKNRKVKRFGEFRREAGVLDSAIKLLKEWAMENNIL